MKFATAIAQKFCPNIFVKHHIADTMCIQGFCIGDFSDVCNIFIAHARGPIVLIRKLRLSHFID